MTAKAKTNGSRSKNRRNSHHSDIEIIVGAPSGHVIEKTGPGRRPATQNKTANDLMFDAWVYTYKTRDRRLTKP